MNNSDIIEFKHIKKSFANQVICQDINLIIPRGRIFSILGPSGCGKTVTIKMLIGLISPDEGEIFFNNIDLVKLEREEDFLAIRRRISMVFQGAALFDSMNVFDNIAYPLKVNTSLNEDIIENKVMNTLDLVGLLDAAPKMPSELSGGMKKRIGLARAIVTDPEVILYDEPTAGLDPINTRRIIDLIRTLEDRFACTSIIISHDMQAVEMLSDRVAFFYAGRVRQVGTFKELKESEDPIVKGFIVGDPNVMLTSYGAM